MRSRSISLGEAAVAIIVTPIIVVAIGWGLITGSSEKGMALYFKGVDTFIVRPVMGVFFKSTDAIVLGATSAGEEK